MPSGVDPELVDVDGLRTGYRLSYTHDGELVMPQRRSSWAMHGGVPARLPGRRQARSRRAPLRGGSGRAGVDRASLGRCWSVGVPSADQAASAAATRDTPASSPPGWQWPDGDELDQLSRDVNEMAGTLERSRALEQQFLLSVSHDLRTPLTSIRGYAEAIADGAADPQRAAAVISAESRRLERLVADLLDLAKVQASSFSLELEPLDLAQLAEVAVDGFAPDATDRGLLLQAITPPLAVTVDADRDRLGQVAANLIENAMKYATTGVVVRVDTVGGRAVFTVTDDGAGIDPADLPHVFERLYVARRQPARRESSSGLGLAIVSQLVEAMGGEVSVTSEVGHGTTFAVMLPCRA
ncbi:MAG: HAMP domain-containing sensor histidine kinase [Ilumatobacteraceae bacterium]